MNEIERHWLDRGGTLMHQFLLRGYDSEQHVAALKVDCGDLAYCNDQVRHAIEGSACEAFRQQYGISSESGTWSDYVMPPYIEEGEEGS